MKHIALLATALFAGLSLQGCATKELGRQSSLTDYEKTAMTCQDIDEEMNRVVAFVGRIKSGSTGSDRHGMELVAALEDRWIGNSMERSAALESANARMIQLWALRDEKKCNTPASAEVRTFPLKREKVEERF